MDARRFSVSIAVAPGARVYSEAVNALELHAQTFLEHIDALAERLRPRRRPQDVRARECTPRELRTLAVLGRDGRVTMSVLAQSLDVPLSTATRTVEGLVAKGLVERAQSASDRRIVEVGFGRRGKRINEYVANWRRAEAREMLAALSTRERTKLLRDLALVIDAAPATKRRRVRASS